MPSIAVDMKKIHSEIVSIKVVPESWPVWLNLLSVLQCIKRLLVRFWVGHRPGFRD